MVKHCHANNRRFADNAFLKPAAEPGQMTSFCGVNAHLKAGLLRNASATHKSRQGGNSYMQRQGSRQQAAEINLWPHAARNTSDARNATPEWELTSQEILQAQHVTKASTQPCIWMPSHCIGQQASRQQQSSQVEPESKAWRQRWSITMTRELSDAGPQLGHGPCTSTMSFAMQQLLQSSATIGRQCASAFTMATRLRAQAMMRKERSTSLQGSLSNARAGANDSAE